MPKNNPRLVTADILERLPTPVQRYMHFTGVVGKPWIDTVRIKFAGKFRPGLDKPWLPMRAEQFYTTNPPGFLWQAQFKMAGLWLIRGQDVYKAGHGHMFGKVAGLFTVFDARGAELDQGTMMRYLNEMVWFPIALLSDYVTWQGVDDHSADVTFSDAGKQVTARLFFDDVGRLSTFVTQRYRENQGKYTFDTWETPMTEYGVLAGLNLPVRGQAVWKLANGDLPYADLRLTEIEYNVPIPAF